MQENVSQRRMLDDFCELSAPAGALVREGQWAGRLEGAPLRCSLHGARLARAGLLATGEAVASDYAFIGKGISKAMETGLLVVVA